ncbi:MAG: diacylglycerol kinase family protein [Pseudomonadota bacterium]
MIAVVVNPRSRANRKNPQLAGQMERALGGGGRVIAAPSLAALDEEARALADTPPRIIAVHGGDGTLHKVLTALLRAFGDRPLPPLALLGGGTMNVVASSLGIRARALPFLRKLVSQGGDGGPPAVIHRRCMRVGDQYGFVFGNGLLANFLVDYYAGDRYGPARAIWLVGRLFLSALVGGPFVARVFRRFQGQVTVDGRSVEFPDLMAVGAGTVREVGLGFKLLHRADDDLERFTVLAIHAGALALVGDLFAVRTGRGISPSHALTAAASDVEITPLESRTPYTIDGDIYYTQGALRITIGPRIAIVDPRR